MIESNSNQRTSYELPQRLSIDNPSDFETIEGMVQKSLRQGIARIFLDASKTQYIDSEGIGFLVRILKDLHTKGGDLCIRDLDGDLYRSFQLTGLDLVFAVDETLENSVVRKQLFKGSPTQQFKVEVVEGDGAGVIQLIGPMNSIGSATHFKEIALLALEKNPRLLLDFEMVTFVDSICANEVKNMFFILANSGGQLRICNLEEPVSGFFTTTGLNMFIPIHKSREEAYRAWREGDEGWE